MAHAIKIIEIAGTGIAGAMQFFGAMDRTYISIPTPTKLAVPTGSTPGSTPGSSSSADTTSVIYEPQPSDLAYLLHDPDEKVYDDSAASPPTPVSVKYIVVISLFSI
jgi:hypothetical protein